MTRTRWRPVPVSPDGEVQYGVAMAVAAVMHGARSIPEVMDMCGWQSKETAHLYLEAAESEGLITWGDVLNERRPPCTIRPALGIAAHTP
jgi:hypothetical protein